MNIATGAMSTLLPKLAELVVGEYKLQKGVKREIEDLNKELASMAEALSKVAEVPPDQLDKQVKIWAGDLRELSYDIEDEVDTFMLRGNQELEHTKPFSLKALIRKATNLYKKAKTNHKIHNAIKDIMGQVKEAAERRHRYDIDNIVISKKVDNTAAKSDIVADDPRLEAMYRKATELVGIGRPKNELAERLLEQDCSSLSRQQSNIISIVGFGGLGKTTLANSLLEDLKSKYDCHIFVSVSLSPDIKKIFKNILLQLDEKKYSHIDEAWEVRQLIDKIIEFLKDRRCLCVIDDLWKESAWDTIKLAFKDGHPGSKIIITTRSKSVAEHVGGGVYELKPLSDGDSRKLLHMRIFATEDGCPPSLVEVNGKILKKCGGVPLAIITIASLLASKPTVEWEEVNKSIGFGLGNNSLDVDKMRKILSLSYNDLPFHLKTCLLSLSKYPEDHLIRKDVVVWSWIAEGFIKQEEETQGPTGKSLQEIGESYFNELINRSLIQPVKNLVTRERDGQVQCCQVHDMVLELINQFSAKEGFVTTLSSEQQASTLTLSALQKQKRNIRRLSLNNNNIESYAASAEASREQLSKLRSLDIFGMVKLIPPLSSFRVLRVLQVDDCSLLDSNHLNDLGKLRRLRFLRLHGLQVSELPESIGEMESLETLDIRQSNGRDNRPVVLPKSFGKLEKLVRLLGNWVELPDGLTLENMTSLREMVGIWVTLHAMTEIGKLGEIKVLELLIPNGLPCKDKNELIAMKSIIAGRSSAHSIELMPLCLRMCHSSLRVLVLRSPGTHYPVDLMARLPSGLQRFIGTGRFLKAFPKWTNPQLSSLTVLYLNVGDMRVLPEDLKKLAELPSLRFLNLSAIYLADEQELLSSASGFPCLTDLELFSPLLFLKFQHGAMPKLQKLGLTFSPAATNKHFQINNFDYGFQNLPSLRHVVIRLTSRNCPEVEDDIRKVVNDHPNHSSLDLAYK